MIYSSKSMYAPKMKKEIGYTPDLFDVEGEAYVENGRINVIIIKIGYDRISSMKDLEEMYEKLEDGLIHEITHYWKTHSQDDLDVYVSADNNDPFGYV